ncbi:MAG: hypothetical protein MUE99_10290, partial [Chitinophagaceae bacterium]|nr:hypothetical protein [Chitinophagaceae bacterium]
TDNLTSYYNQSLGAYVVSFSEPNADAVLQVTPYQSIPCYATYQRVSSGIIIVYIWNKDGVKIQSDFSLLVIQ